MASNFVAHPHIGGRNCGHIGNWRTNAGEEGFYRNDEIASWILGHFAELGTEFAERRPAVGINHPTYSNVTSTEYNIGGPVAVLAIKKLGVAMLPSPCGPLVYPSLTRPSRLPVPLRQAHHQLENSQRTKGSKRF